MTDDLIRVPNRLDGTPSNSFVSATCRHCRHFGMPTRTCVAFPEGIPDAIWFAYHGHREPYLGDRGIQFEARPLPNPLSSERYEIPDFLRRTR